MFWRGGGYFKPIPKTDVIDMAAWRYGNM